MTKRIGRIVFALAVVGAFGVLLYSRLTPSDACEVCQRPMHPQTFYSIVLEDGEMKRVCCPRCGLRFQEGRTDVVAAEVADFESGARIDAASAFYVENSSIHLCSHSPVQGDRSGTLYEVAWDRCLPSLIAFGSLEAADAFRAQNGGTVKTYQQLLAEE